MDEMMDWTKDVPWGAILVALAVLGMIVKFSRWTGHVDSKLETLIEAASKIEKSIQTVLERLATPVAVQGKVRSSSLASVRRFPKVFRPGSGPWNMRHSSHLRFRARKNSSYSRAVWRM